jgi:hypothetical protein
MSGSPTPRLGYWGFGVTIMEQVDFNVNATKSLAAKLAKSAKPGRLKLGNDVYTFEFDKNNWDYIVFKNGDEFVKFATKSLKMAKQWLVEYLQN